MASVVCEVMLIEGVTVVVVNVGGVVVRVGVIVEAGVVVVVVLITVVLICEPFTAKY